MIEVVQNRAELAMLTVPQIISKGRYDAVVSFSFDSELPVTIYGICFSTDTEQPDIESHPYVSQTGTATQGTPTFNLANLSSGTTYYMRAFAISAVGIQYSNNVQFTTYSGIPDEGDNVSP